MQLTKGVCFREDARRDGPPCPAFSRALWAHARDRLIDDVRWFASVFHGLLLVILNRFHYGYHRRPKELFAAFGGPLLRKFDGYGARLELRNHITRHQLERMLHLFPRCPFMCEEEHAAESAA